MRYKIFIYEVPIYCYSHKVDCIMPYQIEWHLENHVLMTTYEGELTIDELRESNQNTKDFVENTSHTVHNIVDINALEKFPTTIKEMIGVADSLKHENIGWFVIIGSNRLQSFVVGVLAQIFGAQIKSVNTLEEALTFLRNVDSDLT